MWTKAVVIVIFYPIWQWLRRLLVSFVSVTLHDLTSTRSLTVTCNISGRSRVAKLSPLRSAMDHNEKGFGVLASIGLFGVGTYSTLRTCKASRYAIANRLLHVRPDAMACAVAGAHRYASDRDEAGRANPRKTRSTQGTAAIRLRATQARDAALHLSGNYVLQTTCMPSASSAAEALRRLTWPCAAG